MMHRTRTPSPCSPSRWPLAALLLAGLTLPAAAIEGMPGPFGERLTIDEKGITLKFPDDAATFRIGGRLQLDFGTGRVQQRGFGTVFDTPIAVRRSWLESYLTLGKEIELAFQYDFADPVRSVQDAVVAYKGFKDVIIALGNMKEPFSLNQLISDNNTLFAERSLADAFAPARNFGFAIGTHGDRWTAVTSVFGGNINTGIENQGVASTTRVTYAPYLSEDKYDVLHVGLAGSYRSLPNDGSALTLSSRSEAFLFARPFVNTGSIRDAASIGRVGLEAAWQTGPFRLQAEYILTEIGRFGGAPSLTFQGGYIQAGLLLNSKGRRYSIAPNYATEYAVFSGVQVEEAQRVSRGGTGVFELGLRYSAIDLQDRAIRGGIEHDVTAGVNWYPDRNIRFVFDYVRSHTSPSPASLNFNRRTIDADVFIGRAQLYW
ncbi:OprO/OprP family phosphate-selective porin [Methylobacterium nonmethylotrophicum]|uniref:Porin n=1 Tax=Methylobacterium nonmethylotrophicum TaxID=1141884 RepID=A0A4Z0NF85_9HYPH|nr:porin [Methylobacterium nonmethylotrophicum]TGD94963.1 porin [Methylobacterium nonmethylotrophicum]